MRSQIIKAKSISSVEMCTYSRGSSNESRSRRSPKTSGRIAKQVKQKASAKFLLPPRAIQTFKQYFLRSTVKEKKKYAEDIPCLPFCEVVQVKESIPIDYVKPQRKNTKINKKYKLAGKTQSNMYSLKQI